MMRTSETFGSLVRCTAAAILAVVLGFETPRICSAAGPGQSGVRPDPGGGLLKIDPLARLSTSSEWNLQVVDNSGDWGYASRIVSKSDGTPCIVYKSSGSSTTLKLTWWVSETDSTGGWRTPVTLDSPGGDGSVGLAVDSDDNLHVAWGRYGWGTLYGVFSTTTENWVISPQVAWSGSDQACDLALFESGTTDTPGIVVLLGGALKFVVRNPATGQWNSPETIQAGNVGGNPSIAVDSQGQFHVAYYEAADYGHLKYAMRLGTTWATQYVDMGDNQGSMGSYCSMVIDSNDVPHIVYYAGGTRGDLKYAKLINP